MTMSALSTQRSSTSCEWEVLDRSTQRFCSAKVNVAADHLEAAQQSSAQSLWEAIRDSDSTSDMSEVSSETGHSSLCSSYNSAPSSWTDLCCISPSETQCSTPVTVLSDEPIPRLFKRPEPHIGAFNQPTQANDARQPNVIRCAPLARQSCLQSSLLATHVWQKPSCLLFWSKSHP